MRKGRHLSLDLMENTLVDVGREETNDACRKRMLRALKHAAEGELTPRQRRCVEMYYWEKIGEKEIAARLGIGVPTVSRHLGKARARLARVMSYYF